MNSLLVNANQRFLFSMDEIFTKSYQVIFEPWTHLSWWEFMKLSKLLSHLICPRCNNDFRLDSLEVLSKKGNEETYGWLACEDCNSLYPLTNSIISLLIEFDHDDPAIRDMASFLNENQIESEPYFRRVNFRATPTKKKSAKFDWNQAYEISYESNSRDLMQLPLNFKNPLLYFINKFIRNYGEKEKRIIEVGIGTGNFALPLAFRFDVFGLDYSYTALRILHQRAKEYRIADKVGVVRADLFRIPFKPVFTHVLSLGLIEHFRNPIKSLLQHKKLCKESGFLFVDVPNSQGIWMKIYALKRRIEQKNGTWRLGLEYSFSIETLSDFLIRSGFKVLESFATGYRLAVGSAFSLNATKIPEKLLKFVFGFLFIVTTSLSRYLDDQKEYKYGFYSIVIGKMAVSKK
ncbi:MAG: methyltransferase domain-containing protein [Candidatus Heimdallarchaeota archaeon]